MGISSNSIMGFIVKWWKRQLILRATRQTMIMIFPLVQRIKILIGCSASGLSSGTLEGRLLEQIILKNVLSLSLSVSMFNTSNVSSKSETFVSQ